LRLRLASVAALMALAIAACAAGPGTAPASTGAATVELQVFGAASLKKVLARVAQAYEAANPGITLAISTDASSSLETKIEQGAPADVFLAADTAMPAKLAGAGLVAGNMVEFARNRLAVIVPAGNPAGIRTPADLARPGVKVIAAGDTVPVTAYANQLVEGLARQPSYPAGYVDAYAANIVSREDNAAAIVAKISLGEGDAAIVYATDALASDTVDGIAIPPVANVAATYGGVVVKASPHIAEAERFLAWLTGPEGRAVLAADGFMAPA
jgi:molybdate transport system substrate-binding protein